MGAVRPYDAPPVRVPGESSWHRRGEKGVNDAAFHGMASLALICPDFAPCLSFSGVHLPDAIVQHTGKRDPRQIQHQQCASVKGGAKLRRVAWQKRGTRCLCTPLGAGCQFPSPTAPVPSPRPQGVSVWGQVADTAVLGESRCTALPPPGTRGCGTDPRPIAAIPGPSQIFRPPYSTSTYVSCLPRSARIGLERDKGQASTLSSSRRGWPSRQNPSSGCRR